MAMLLAMLLYSYLNLESTKTDTLAQNLSLKLYSYLNLESTKTSAKTFTVCECCTVT